MTVHTCQHPAPMVALPRACRPIPLHRLADGGFVPSQLPEVCHICFAMLPALGLESSAAPGHCPTGNRVAVRSRRAIGIRPNARHGSWAWRCLVYNCDVGDDARLGSPRVQRLSQGWI